MASGPSSEVTPLRSFSSVYRRWFSFLLLFIRRKLFNRVPMFLTKSIDVPSGTNSGRRLSSTAVQAFPRRRLDSSDS